MERVIQESVKQIPIWQLKDSAVRSLRNFANKQYNTLFRALGLPSAFLMLIASVIDESIPAKQREVIARQIELNYKENIPVGVPLQTYAKQYTEEKLKPVLDELSTQNALDPDDVSGRNSLRNRAEMEVRYDDHLESISKLKEDGNKLVIASSHADCSQRCSPWQGRVYSLDGTSGTTPDGRKFVPLEEATDIYYTTKAGRTYKNGLLGFNCYDETTEVLTNDGWKLFQELTIDDLVYTLNITTKISEWQKPIAYYKKYYVGEMINLIGNNINIFVTPDHNILIDSYVFVKADKVVKDYLLLNKNLQSEKITEINKINYNGFVYCIEVPNHTLLVKRNGKIQWCGNCRHYLMPYKDGLKPPKPNKELERKEREITQRQRELERNVRLWRTRALEYKNVDYNAYRQAKEQAIKWNKYYIEFSKNNGRAYYPSRTKII